MPTPIKVVANYWLWRFGLRPVLPGRYIQRLPVEDNGEPLVPLSGRSPVLLDHRLGVDHLLRASVADALDRAGASLPDGLQLLVVEGYRSPQRQQQCWESERETVARAHPLATAAEVDRLTSLVVANPSNNNSGGHQTGGAVDLTLADHDGNELWMGTDVQAFTSATPTQAAVDAEVDERRRVLRAAMESAGFVNYPGEWWHYARGDRLWAAYKRLPKAHYGPC